MRTRIGPTGGTVEFELHPAGDTVDLVFDAAALRTFVRLGAEMLAALDARPAQRTVTPHKRKRAAPEPDGPLWLSTWIGVPHGGRIECRINGQRDMEFRLGAAQDGAELVLQRFAVQRLAELAMAALAEPLPVDKDSRPVHVSEVTRPRTTTAEPPVRAQGEQVT